MAILKDILGNLKHWLSKILQKVWYTKAIERRLKRKIKEHERIRVVFICHRPSVWGALKTVYEAFCKDTLFETMMVTIPQRDDNQPDGYIDEGADEYFDQYNPIRGFDKGTKQYMNIKKLRPDIVFYQQPYDVMREKDYQSSQVKKYAKIGYISYFSTFPGALNDDIVLNTCYPMDFFGNISYFFSQNIGEDLHIKKLLSQKKITSPHVYLTGYPKYDNLPKYKSVSSTVWRLPMDETKFKILWTPRWTTNENSCHFFAFKEHWFEYCRREQYVDFVFRPHPQTWIEWEQTGEFTKEQKNKYFESIAQTDNMSIDESKEYLETFYSSDCLVSDVSSMVLQYLLTGKPIIYCHNPNSQIYFKKDSKISAGMYWAEDWDDVERYLQQLQAGVDPLKTIRENIIQLEYKIDDDISAGEKSKEFIKEELLTFLHK